MSKSLWMASVVFALTACSKKEESKVVVPSTSTTPALVVKTPDIDLDKLGHIDLRAFTADAKKAFDRETYYALARSVENCRLSPTEGFDSSCKAYEDFQRLSRERQSDFDLKAERTILASRLLTHSNPSVRAMGARLLDVFTPDRESEFKPLLKAAEAEQDPAVLNVMLGSLMTMATYSPELETLLLRTLQSPQTQIRLRTVEMMPMGILREASPTLVERLIELAEKDPSPQVRSRIITALGTSPHPNALSFYQRKLGDVATNPEAGPLLAGLSRMWWDPNNPDFKASPEAWTLYLKSISELVKNRANNAGDALHPLASGPSDYQAFQKRNNDWFMDTALVKVLGDAVRTTDGNVGVRLAAVDALKTLRAHAMVQTLANELSADSDLGPRLKETLDTWN